MKTSNLKQMLLQNMGSPYQNHGIIGLTKISTTSSTPKNGWVMRMEKATLYLHKLSIQWWQMIVIAVKMLGFVFA